MYPYGYSQGGDDTTMIIIVMVILFCSIFCVGIYYYIEIDEITARWEHYNKRIKNVYFDEDCYSIPFYYKSKPINPF